MTKYRISLPSLPLHHIPSFHKQQLCNFILLVATSPRPSLPLCSPALIHFCVSISRLRFFFSLHYLSLSALLPCLPIFTFLFTPSFSCQSIFSLLESRIPPPAVPLVFKASNPSLRSFIHEKWSLPSSSIISSIPSHYPPFSTFFELVSLLSLSLTACLTLIPLSNLPSIFYSSLLFLQSA